MEDKKIPIITTNHRKIGQEQLYDMLVSPEISWHSLIYELIETEKLDPWDVDITRLANSYLTRIQEMEEANFFISSKILLAASLLLRLKSELLLNKYITSIDDILFEKEEDKRNQEEISIGEIPELIPKSPLPRLKKVTLKELIDALDKAIKTEHRRIQKQIIAKRYAREVDIVLPKIKINLKDRLQTLFSKIQEYLKNREKVTYSEIVGKNKEDRIASFLPLLYLDTQEKIFLHQQTNEHDIDIYLKNNISKELEKELMKDLLEIAEVIETEQNIDLSWL